MHLSSKTKRICIVTSVLVLIYVLFVYAVPHLKIWALTYTVNYNSDRMTTIKEGDVYEQVFSMPFGKICAVELPMDPNGSDHVVSFYAVMSILDNEGNVIAEKNITSVYDAATSFNYIAVDKGADYRMRLSIRSIDQGSYAVPSLMTDGRGNICFKLQGLSDSSDNKIVFALVFLIFSVVLIVYAMVIEKDMIGDEWLADNTLIAIIILLATFVICQFSDLFDISKTSMTLIDSFVHGHIKYMDYAYFEGLKVQSESQEFICDYNFISIAVMALALLPLYPFYGKDFTYNWGGYAVVIDLLITILLCVLLSLWLIRFITKECGLDNRYLMNVRTLVISSSMLLYMTIGFGQIDIIYIVMILLALPFYFRKKYMIFSLLMSVAVAMKTLPFIIFLPLLLLAVKKVKDIVINMAIVLVVPLMTKFIFGGGAGYNFVMGANEDIYGYKNRVIDMTLGSNLSVFVLCAVIICVVAYFYKTDTDDKKEMLRSSMLIIFIMYACFAAFVDWHQQWLIPLVYSFAFLLPFYKDNKRLLLLSAVAESLFILDTNLQGVSMYMMNYGVFPPIVRQAYGGASMRVIITNISPILPAVINTAFVGVLFYIAWYMYKNRSKGSIDSFECPRQWVIGRTGILYGFILFYCWCFSYIG